MAVADAETRLTCGFGADDGIRTRDPHLGKVVLYQLSHVRVASSVPEPVQTSREVGAGPA